MTILDRYILRKHAGPFAFAASTITFFFVMKVLVDHLDLFATRNIGFLTILETFTLSLGWIFAMTFPMAVLVAAVMAFGRLSQDSELDAIHAGGVSFLRILMPVLGVSVLFTGALVLYNDQVLPNANHRLKTLTADIHKMRPTIAIREDVFIDDFDGYRLLVQETDDENNLIYGVTIYVIDPREPARTIHAPWGELIYDDEGNELVIRLHDGEIHEVDRDDASVYYLMDFETQDIIFSDLGTKLERREIGGPRSDRELSTGTMRELARTLEAESVVQSDSLRSLAHTASVDLRDSVRRALAASDPAQIRPSEFSARARILMRKIQNADRRIVRKQREVNRYRIEIHKKYAFSVACIVFVLVGAPLGVRAKRGGLGVGGGLSFLFFLVYYMASVGGETLGDRGLIPPAVGMWAVNVLLGIGGLLLVLRKDDRFPFRRRAAR